MGAERGDGRGALAKEVLAVEPADPVGKAGQERGALRLLHEPGQGAHLEIRQLELLVQR